MTMVLAADIAMGGTGIAIGDGTCAPETRVLAPKDWSRPGKGLGDTVRMSLFARWFAARLKEYRPEVVGIEAPFVKGDRPNAARVLFGMVGIAQAECGRFGLKPDDVLLVNIGKWREAIFGRGQSRGFTDPFTGAKISGRDNFKDMALRLCRSVRWETGGDDNRAEAACIWAYVHTIRGNQRGVLRMLSAARSAA